jgi:hypothetical protein
MKNPMPVEWHRVFGASHQASNAYVNSITAGPGFLGVLGETL